MASQFIQLPDGSWAQQVVTGGGGEVTVNSNAIIPVDIQSRYATTVQTHNAVSVPLSGISVASTFVDADGFVDVGVTLTNDAATSCSLDIIWSNDGTSLHGQETVIASAASIRRAGLTSVKARYFKIQVSNGDGAAAHTMSAWAYLKA